MTYEGFHHMMDSTFSRKLDVFYTEDSSPARKDDNEISPMKLTVHRFELAEYLSETSPGHVSFLATQRYNPTLGHIVVHRICSQVDGKLLTVSLIEDGLFPNDIEVFESYHTIRLVNKGLPKTSFSVLAAD